MRYTQLQPNTLPTYARWILGVTASLSAIAVASIVITTLYTYIVALPAKQTATAHFASSVTMPAGTTLTFDKYGALISWNTTSSASFARASFLIAPNMADNGAVELSVEEPFKFGAIENGRAHIWLDDSGVEEGYYTNPVIYITRLGIITNATSSNITSSDITYPNITSSTTTIVINNTIGAHTLTFLASTELPDSRVFSHDASFSTTINDTHYILSRTLPPVAGMSFSNIIGIAFSNTTGDIISVTTGPSPGSASGCATLDSNGQLLSEQIPSSIQNISTSVQNIFSTPLLVITNMTSQFPNSRVLDGVSDEIVIANTTIGLAHKPAWSSATNMLSGVLCDAAIDNTGRLDSASTCSVVRSVSGAANQIIVTGTETLSIQTPQDIDENANVAFASAALQKLQLGQIALFGSNTPYNLSLPSTEPQPGQIVAAATASTLTWITPSTVPQILFYTTTPSTTSSTSYTSIFGTGTGSRNIAANTLQPGRRIRIRLTCSDSAAILGSTYAMQVLLGSTIVAQMSSLSITGSSIAVGNLELMVTSVSGTTATVVSTGTFVRSALVNAIGLSSGSSIATNIAQTLDVRVAFGALGGSLTCAYAAVEFA